jgi:hypothetical protein
MAAGCDTTSYIELNKLLFLSGVSFYCAAYLDGLVAVAFVMQKDK